MIDLLKDYWDYLKNKKKYWIIPIVIVLLLVSLIVVFAEGSALAPFIYTVF